jgi:hypothetical protein
VTGGPGMEGWAASSGWQPPSYSAASSTSTGAAGTAQS